VSVDMDVVGDMAANSRGACVCSSLYRKSTFLYVKLPDDGSFRDPKHVGVLLNIL